VKKSHIDEEIYIIRRLDSSAVQSAMMSSSRANNCLVSTKSLSEPKKEFGFLPSLGERGLQETV